MRGPKLLVLVVGLIWSIGTAVGEPVVVDATTVELTIVANAIVQQPNSPALDAKLTEASARRLAEFTKKNIGRRIAVRIESNPLVTANLISSSDNGTVRLYLADIRILIQALASTSEIEVVAVSD